MKRLLLLLMILSVLIFSACEGNENSSDTDGSATDALTEFEQGTPSQESEKTAEDDKQGSEESESDTKKSDETIELPKVGF